MRCGRCTTTRCARHALEPGQRCDACEADWADDAAQRRSAKLMLAPSIAVITGGLLFGLLLPISLGALGTAIMGAIVCGSAVGAGAGTCTLVDRSARAVFLRERAGALPAARLLPSPRHR